MESYSSIPIEELLRRCSAGGDAAAWQEFVSRFHKPIGAVVLRVAAQWGDGSRQTVDDLMQETYLKLCTRNYRILREFEHRSPAAFVACVRVIAANVVRDYFKGLHSQKRHVIHVNGIEIETAVEAGEGSAGGAMANERGALIQDVQRHLQVLLAGPDCERNTRVFWLYYRVGLSAAAIAALPEMDLKSKGVESLIYRMTRDLRERMAVAPPLPCYSAPQSRKGIFPAQSF